MNLATWKCANGCGGWQGNVVGWRLGILLEREGVSLNKKKLFRLYREEGLAVRRRRGGKRATGMRTPMAVPDGPNQRWSLDFVADSLSWGR